MRRKVRVPFCNCKTEVPVVKFYLDNGYEAFAIIDSGSESTVFDKDIIKRNKDSFKLDITENKMNLVGMSTDKNTVHVVYASATVSFEDVDSNEHPMDLNGIVVPLSHISQHCKDSGDDITISAIIGSDALTKFGVKINYRKKELSIP